MIAPHLAADGRVEEGGECFVSVGCMQNKHRIVIRGIIVINGEVVVMLTCHKDIFWS